MLLILINKLIFNIYFSLFKLERKWEQFAHTYVNWWIRWSEEAGRYDNG